MNTEIPEKKKPEEPSKISKKSRIDLKGVMLVVLLIVVVVGLGYLVFTDEKEINASKNFCISRGYEYDHRDGHSIICRETHNDFEIELHHYSKEAIK